MKRFMTFVATLLSSSFLLVAPVHADNSFWSLVQDPLTKQTSTNFNVGYTVLSTSQHDFVVSLYEDGSSTAVGTQHTQVAGDSNTNFGNSGKFAVTLSNGTHNLTLTAVRDDNDTKTVNSSVTVDTTQPAPTVVTTTRTIVAVPAVPGTTVASSLSAASLANGSVLGTTTTSGEVNAPGAATSSAGTKAGSRGKVLGVATNKNKAINSHSAAWWYSGGGVLVVLLIVAYYLRVMRPNRRPN